ncbi:Serine/threonine protein kinase, family, partial [mine drainage metagenome]
MLLEFFQRNMITDIIGQLKAGKEAQVFVCRAHPETGHQLLAAKVYKSREMRSFHNETTYLEGRSGLVRGRAAHGSVARAIERRSRAGKALLEATWIRHEYEVLRRLRRADARVPDPIAVSDHAVLMT